MAAALSRIAACRSILLSWKDNVVKTSPRNLLVAVVLVAAARGLPAVFAIVAAGLVVGLGGLARLAVARGWLAEENAFAVAASLVWLFFLGF